MIGWHPVNLLPLQSSYDSYDTGARTSFVRAENRRKTSSI
jgi:hypothetical protein